MLFETGRIEYLYGLANVRGFFPEVDSRFKFTLLGTQKGGQTKQFKTLFLLSHADWPQITDSQDASDIMASVITDENRIFSMDINSIRRFSPETLGIMEFKSKQDYFIAEKIYGDWPLMGEEVQERWNPKLGAEFHMTNARSLFNQNGKGFPLYEGKMIHQFDSYFAEPQYWIEENKGRSSFFRREQDENQVLGYQQYRLAYRDIARSTDQRTIIATILPTNSFAGNTLILETTTQNSVMFYFLALLNSFILDYIVRYKVGTHVSMFYAYQLPMPRLTVGDPYFDAIVPRAAQLSCPTAAFAPLWQEVMGTPWSETVVANDPAQRQQLRNELDALVAHLYGLSRDEFAHILSTFPLVFPNTEAGEAKKETLLTVFDTITPRAT